MRQKSQAVERPADRDDSRSTSSSTSVSHRSFLGSSVRKKILSLLREEVRREATLPEYIAVGDLTETSGLEEPCKVREEFFNRVWRAEYLGDRNEDYVDLKVPFEEKNAAKARVPGGTQLAARGRSRASPT